MRQDVMARRCGLAARQALWSLAGIGGVLAGLCAIASQAHAQECPPAAGVERLSVSSSGTPGNASSEIPTLNANGCIVAFKSFATNLIDVDTNDKVDVFVRDRGNSTTVRIPGVLFSGTQPKDNSYPPDLDASGDLVGFGSLSNNLVAGDFNQQSDVFIYARGAATTEALSFAQNGDSGGRVPDQPPSVSADGNWVVFTSASGDLAPGDDNQTNDVFLVDRSTGARMLVSQTTTGSQPGTAGNASSGGGAISGDNCNVAFYSHASDIVPHDTNGDRDVFLRHVCPPQSTERLNLSTAGDQATRPSDRVLSPLEYPPAISNDGHVVAFVSDQNGLDNVDSGGLNNVFLRVHGPGGTGTVRVSIGFDGTPANGASTSPSMSADGRFIVFSSAASNLVPDDTNNHADIFVYELGKLGLHRVSLSAGGAQGDGDSTFPQISADGSTIVFQSDATNLVDNDTNGVSDIFIIANPLAGPTPTPTAGEFCESMCQPGEGCRREVGGVVQDGECVPDRDCLCVVGGTETPTPSVTVTATRTKTAVPDPTPTTPPLTPSLAPTQPSSPTPTAGDSCGAVCSAGQGCRRQVGGQIMPGVCVPEQNCLCIVGGLPTPTPTAGDSCGAVCSVGQGCRRQVGGQILPGECVPAQNCLCIVGGTATPTLKPDPTPSATPPPTTKPSPTATNGGGGGGGGGGCGCRIDPATGRVADSLPWPSVALPVLALLWRRRQQQR